MPPPTRRAGLAGLVMVKPLVRSCTVSAKPRAEARPELEARAREPETSLSQVVKTLCPYRLK